MFRVYFIAAVVTLCIGVNATENRNVGKDVYEVLPTGRYYLNIKPLTWYAAFQTCRNRSSHLVVINSQEEADVLSEMMSRNRISQVHVGFHDQYQEGKYINILDQAVNSTGYGKWKPGFPTGLSTYNCGSFSGGDSDPRNAGLSDIMCGITYPSICEERLWDGYDMISTDAGTVNSIKGFYKLHNEQRTWPEAWEMCRLEGAHLLIVNSVDELKALTDKYGLWGYSWVGVHQIHGRGAFVTIFNDNLDDTGYNTWISGHPILDDVARRYVGVANNVGLVTQLTDSISKFICEHGNVA